MIRTGGINTYVDRIFYINMDRDVERNQNIIKEFNKNNIWNYERIPGVVVKDIPENHRIKGPWDKDLDKEAYIRGSIGCLMSHKKIIETALDRGYEKICIFEDDILLIDNFEERFSSYINKIEDMDTPYQIAYLGLCDEDDRDVMPDGSEIKQVISHAYCAHGYIINNLQWVFNYILQNINSQFQEIDLIYNSLIFANDPNFIPVFTKCYVSIPNLVEQLDEFGSNIQNIK